jgi:tetratricopeptide (TPR) repeat protein
MPRITDFGLAKDVTGLPDGGDGEKSLTRSGMLLGSPNYMAPEQARCQRRDIGPATDVYALGVILYELLTGRPPFRGETAVDTLQQVVAVEPVPPRRLQPKVARDLETICLKCLEKQPRKRYGSARELEEDLGRFLAGQPIRARPAGWVEQFIKWVRRGPLRAALWASSLVVVLASAGGLLWYSRERAQRREATTRDVLEACQEANLWRTRARTGDPTAWGKALAAVSRARTLLERGEGDAQLVGRVQELREELQEEETNRRLVASLDEIRQRQSEIHVDAFDLTRADQEYAQAFKDAGIDVETLEPAEAAEQIRARAIRSELVAALDDWSLLRRVTRKGDPEASRRLLEIARRADPDPWRDPLRRALARSDRQALKKLAAQKEVASLSAPTSILFGNTLGELGDIDQAVLLLQQAHRRYPDDFWINFHLASFFLKTKPPQADEAVRFATAALALRSGSAGAHLRLGAALAAQRRRDEAIAEYQEAIRLSKGYTSAHNNLGVIYYQEEKFDEAIRAYRDGIRGNPNHPQPHYNLGLALVKTGRRVEAIAEFREAVRLDKDFTSAYLDLGLALQQEGLLDDAIAAFQTALHGNQRNARAWFSLANAFQKKQQLDQAIAGYREALRIRPDYLEAHLNLALALDREGLTDEAIAEYREVLRINNDFSQAHFNLAGMLYRKGQMDEAIAEYREVLRSNPDHVGAHNNLGVILSRKGQDAEAIHEYREALRIDKKNPLAHYNLGAALHRQGQMDQAIAEYREALGIEPKYARAHHDLGLALVRQGQMDEAIRSFRRAHELDPDRVDSTRALGEALRSRGRFDEALDVLRQHRGRLAPTDPHLSRLERVIRETESMAELAPRLDLYLAGKAQPAGAAERLTLAQLCRDSRQKNRAAARFFAEAFVERPALAEDLEAAHRYHAACAAALAGCGRGQDAQEIDAMERARWRKQALDWLRADLALRVAQMKSPSSVAEATGNLGYWQLDPDLAGLRDQDGLAKLPAPEREEWQKLWAEVRRLRAGAAGGR